MGRQAGGGIILVARTSRWGSHFPPRHSEMSSLKYDHEPWEGRQPQPQPYPPITGTGGGGFFDAVMPNSTHVLQRLMPSPPFHCFLENSERGLELKHAGHCRGRLMAVAPGTLCVGPRYVVCVRSDAVLTNQKIETVSQMPACCGGTKRAWHPNA